MCSNEVHPSKAPTRICILVERISTLFRAVQSLKAKNPIVLTVSGKTILVKALQPRKAKSPITLNPFGISTSVKFAHPSNSQKPISFVPCGIIVSTSIISNFSMILICLHHKENTYTCHIATAIKKDCQNKFDSLCKI